MYNLTLVSYTCSNLLKLIFTYINPDFSKFLGDGKLKHKAILNKILYKEFEAQRVLFGNGKIKCEAGVSLPKEFIDVYGKSIEAEVKKMNGVEFENDTLYISLHVMEHELFHKALEGIKSCIISALDENECKVTIFYLVGGFGGCKFIHEKIKTATARFLSPIYVTSNVIVLSLL